MDIQARELFLNLYERDGNLEDCKVIIFQIVEKLNSLPLKGIKNSFPFYGKWSYRNTHNELIERNTEIESQYPVVPAIVIKNNKLSICEVWSDGDFGVEIEDIDFEFINTSTFLGALNDCIRYLVLVASGDENKTKLKNILKVLEEELWVN